MDRWSESWLVRRSIRVDLDWSAPGRSPVGGGGQCNLIELAFGEACVLPDDVELAARGVDGRLGNNVTRPDRLSGIGISHEGRPKLRDDLRLRPGVAAVGRFHVGNVEGHAGR